MLQLHHSSYRSALMLRPRPPQRGATCRSWVALAAGFVPPLLSHPVQKLHSFRPPGLVVIHPQGLRHGTIRRKKKLALKSCAEYDLQVTEERVNSFEFAHLDASDKVTCVSRICGNCQSLETARPLLDAEMSKCRLICSNCHKLETRQRNVHLQYC